MTNLQDLLDKLASNSRIQSHLVKAKEAYEQKPFALEYRQTYEAINQFSFIPSGLSIVSSSLVAVSIFQNLPIWLALSIGLVLALALEVLKGFTTKLGFRSWFKSGKFNLILCASIALYLASIALSSFGSMNAYQMLDSSMKHDVSANTQSLKDSTDSNYQKLIAEARNNAKQYFGSVSWKGKISHKNAKTYNLMLEKVAILENEHKANLETLKHKETSMLAKTDERLAPYLFILIAIALLNEAVIFFFSRFKEYYLFKSNQQIEQISQAEVLTINLDSLSSLGQLLQLSANDSKLFINSNSTGSGSGSIGFQSANKHPVHSTRSTTGGKEADRLAPRKCENCSTVYKPSVAWQKYCKKECNHIANDFKLKK